MPVSGGKSMKHVDFELDGKKVHALEVQLPGAPLVLAWGKDGFVMCGYLNIEAAEKLGVAAALVRGVKTVDDLLAAKIQQVSKAGAARGIEQGMAGRDALARLS
jgi:uncharacterized protein YunC (DUF1805 family)